MRTGERSDSGVSRPTNVLQRVLKSPFTPFIVSIVVVALIVFGFLWGSSATALVTVQFLGPTEDRAAFRITNVHRRSIQFGYAPEGKTTNGWPIDNLQSGSAWPLPALTQALKAGEDIVVSVPVSRSEPWRLVVVYSKQTFTSDEVTFKMAQMFSRFGFDWIAERIPSAKYRTWIVASPEVND